MADGGNSSGGGNGKTLVKSVTDYDGSIIDLSDSPLRYGDKDPALKDKQREKVEAWEERRKESKVEFATVVTEDGKTLMEQRGGKNSVRTPLQYLQEPYSTMSHIHPRGKDEPGQLGGTFSEADLIGFSRRAPIAYRAVAKEGTYSISKTPSFKSLKFQEYVRSLDSKRIEMNKKIREVGKKAMKYSDYQKEVAKVFNAYLVDLHNALLAGQKQYGYNYTLEKRG